jgi:large subunit ribosomal protein L22
MSHPMQFEGDKDRELKPDPDHQAQAVARMLRISPQKLGLVARTIRGKKVATAFAHLQFLRKRSAREVMKCLESAVANAENNHDLDIDNLFVTAAFVDNGPTLKRSQAAGRGRSRKVEKPFSTLTVVVGGLLEEAELRKKKKIISTSARENLIEALKRVRKALSDRSRYDQDVTQVSSLIAEADRGPKRLDLPRHRVALQQDAAAVAAAMVSILVCGTDRERITAYNCLELALSLSGQEQDVAAYLESERVPCVTEVVFDAEQNKSPKGRPIHFTVGVTHMIRVGVTYPNKVGKASMLARLRLWPDPLKFSVRVRAPGAKIEPAKGIELNISPKDSSLFKPIMVQPTKAGHLPVTVDFMLGNDRFARRVLDFEIT